MLEEQFDKAELYMQMALEIYTQSNHVDCYKALENLSSLFGKKAKVLLSEPQTVRKYQQKSTDCMLKAYDIVMKNFIADSEHHKRLKNIIKLTIGSRGDKVEH